MKRFSFSFFISFLLGIALYVPLLPMRFTWENQGGDAGDFLTAILTNGVPHPGGYPLYLLLGELFQNLPVPNPYWKGAFFSAFCMAISAGLLALWVEKVLLKEKPLATFIGVFSAFLWLSTSLVWSQALIVEVHGLHALIVMVWVWWISALLGEAPVSLRALSLLSGMAGLGVGNHLSIGLLLPVVIWAFFCFWRRTSFKEVGVQVVLFGLGLLIYGALPLRARANPPVNWGGASDWEGFWWLVSGKLYQGMLFDVNFNQLVSRFSAFSRLWLNDFRTGGVILALLGFVNITSRRVGKVLLWIFLAFVLFSFGYAAEDSQVYLIPSWIVLSIWMAVGIVEVKDWRWKAFPIGWALLGLFFLWSVWSLSQFARQVDVRGKEDAALFAEQALQSLPVDALVVTLKDQDTFPLWYYHFGLSYRPDLRLIVLPLTPYTWYRRSLQKAYPDLQYPPDDVEGISWGELLLELNAERPICRTSVETQPVIHVSYACREN